MTSKPPPPPSSTSRTTASSTTNVRRNLFHHQLSRRPPKHDGLTATAAPSSLQESQQQDDSLEIVSRDRNGNYQAQMPVLPPLEEEERTTQEEDGGGGGEKDKTEARLLELLREQSVQPGEPLGTLGSPAGWVNDELTPTRVAELLAAVQSSLRRKVASLHEDNWLFEAEQGTPDG